MGTPCRTVTTLTAVDSAGDSETNDFLSELAEIGVGTAILALRRVNIQRRKFVKEIPQAEPFVDAVLEGIEAIVPPFSAVVGAAMTTVADAIDGEGGDQLHHAGLLVTEIGPELLRLSGLTKRG